MSEATAAQPFTLVIEQSATTATVFCQGRLVAGVTDQLYDPVKKLLPEVKTLILDLGEVTYMDSMGLGTLVRLYASSKSAGCSLELVHLGKRVRELLGVTGLLNVFSHIGEHGMKF
jgi:anti-sigma B factor antagonist